MSRVRRYRWWEFALRAVGIVVATVGYGTLFLIRRLLGAPPSLSYRIFPRWARAVLRSAGIELRVRGAERLDPSERYIFIANHASLFDIPVLLVASPVPIRILYKRQLQRVPFLGWALRASTFIPVERERPQTAGKTVQQTLATLDRDSAALLVFPEGTRTRNGEVGQFRRGAFAIALASSRRLVPVAIAGTHAILPPDTLRFSGGTVHVEFLDPVEPPKLPTRDHQRQWIESFRQRIVAALEHHRFGHR
ncbi:MAG: 1-acyl-sn-glycerol-3-phosphate acyltransferase [Chlorobi bacterium]|nr:1-acyl-sn-glycerol-3-phosphate acyltransferase [Chlorobiota bacterium]